MSNENPFVMGKQAAFNELVEGADQGCSFGECINWAVSTANSDMDKEAAQESVDYRVGAEAVCYGLQKQASAMMGNYQIDDEAEALAISLQKMASGEPIPEQNNEAYRMGKEAAFEGLVESYQQGTPTGEVMGTIHEVINSGISKEASEQDKDVQMGIHNICHSFLEKTAHLYGQIQPESQQDHQEIFKVALEKVAVEDEEAQEEQSRMPSKGQVAGGAAGAAGLAGLADLAHGAYQGHQGGAGALSGAVGRAKHRGQQAKALPGKAKNLGQKGIDKLKALVGKGGGGGEVTTASLNEDQMAKEAGLISGQPSQNDVADAFETMKEAGAFTDEGLQELEAQGLLDD